MEQRRIRSGLDEQQQGGKSGKCPVQIAHDLETSDGSTSQCKVLIFLLGTLQSLGCELKRFLPRVSS